MDCNAVSRKHMTKYTLWPFTSARIRLIAAPSDQILETVLRGRRTCGVFYLATQIAVSSQANNSVEKYSTLCRRGCCRLQPHDAIWYSLCKSPQKIYLILLIGKQR